MPECTRVDIIVNIISPAYNNVIFPLHLIRPALNIVLSSIYVVLSAFHIIVASLYDIIMSLDTISDTPGIVSTAPGNIFLSFKCIPVALSRVSLTI